MIFPKDPHRNYLETKQKMGLQVHLVKKREGDVLTRASRVQNGNSYNTNNYVVPIISDL